MAHTTQKDLNKKLTKARKQVAVGALYYHYKSPEKPYRVLGVYLLEETEEPCVVYQSIYDLGLAWVRTINNFTEKIEANGKRSKRFIKMAGE